MVRNDLWRRLQLDPDTDNRIAFVGGGGKTSLLYGLGREAAAMDKLLLMSTTTHMRQPQGYELCKTPEDVCEALWSTGVALAGKPVGSRTKFGLMPGLEKCIDSAQVILLEADGSRNKPLKIPAEYEPVIPDWVNTVIAVTGLDSLGKPIYETCHRQERVSEFLGVGLDHVINERDIARILATTHGGRKGVGDRTFRCVLNKADTPELRMAGERIAQTLADQDIRSCVLSLAEKEREDTCWF